MPVYYDTVLKPVVQKFIYKSGGKPLKKQPPFDEPTCRVVFIDQETTGLNLDEDEVIEIALVSCTYGSRSLMLYSIDDLYEGRRCPKKDIPLKITKLTGIGIDDVRGRDLDYARIFNIVNNSNLIVAHNAAFDRPMFEKLFSDYGLKLSHQKFYWGCSLIGVDWTGMFHKSGSNLQILFKESGLTYCEGVYPERPTVFVPPPHGAMGDVMCLISVLQANDCSFAEIVMSARLGFYMNTFSEEQNILSEDTLSKAHLKGMLKKKNGRYFRYSRVPMHDILGEPIRVSASEAFRCVLSDEIMQKISTGGEVGKDA